MRQWSDKHHKEIKTISHCSVFNAHEIPLNRILFFSSARNILLIIVWFVRTFFSRVYFWLVSAIWYRLRIISNALISSETKWQFEIWRSRYYYHNSGSSVYFVHGRLWWCAVQQRRNIKSCCVRFVRIDDTQKNSLFFSQSVVFLLFPSAVLSLCVSVYVCECSSYCCCFASKHHVALKSTSSLLLVLTIFSLCCSSWILLCLIFFRQ